ncbi:MAG: cytochrome c-type biogenesis protein [Actinomycetota bacterium]
MRYGLLSVVATLLVAVASGAHAAPEDTANWVARNIMSPYCPGVTLHDCPSAEAITLRTRIEGWAEDGMSRATIMDRLVDEFGPSIRAAPPAEGAGLLAWVLPGLAVIAGGTIAFLAARRWNARPPSEDVAVRTLSDDDRNRLEADLRNLRGEQ